MRINAPRSHGKQGSVLSLDLRVVSIVLLILILEKLDLLLLNRGHLFGSYPPGSFYHLAVSLKEPVCLDDQGRGVNLAIELPGGEDLDLNVGGDIPIHLSFDNEHAGLDFRVDDGLSFNPTNAPAHDSNSVNHRCVGVGSDQRVGVGYEPSIGFFGDDQPSQVLEVDLVTDSGIRRDNPEIVKTPLGPFQKGVSLRVPLIFLLRIFPQSPFRISATPFLSSILISKTRYGLPLSVIYLVSSSISTVVLLRFQLYSMEDSRSEERLGSASFLGFLESKEIAQFFVDFPRSSRSSCLGCTSPASFLYNHYEETTDLD